MKRRTTREDVAERAGVSKTTVTYVLNNRMDIAIPDTTRKRVKNAAAELGYRPHAAASALRSGRTKTVTAAFPIRLSGFYTHVLQAFERECNAHGFHLITTTIGHIGMQNVEPDVCDVFSSLTDGIVLFDMPAAFIPHIHAQMHEDIPVVSAGIFTIEGTDRVRVDLEPAVEAALTHLLASNPSRVAFIGGGISTQDEFLESFAPYGKQDVRFATYSRYMNATNRPLEIISGSPSNRTATMASLRDYINVHGCPDAIFCFNDEIAIAANRIIREEGLSVPDDVILVGCDGCDEGEYISPPLSTIVQPVAKLCTQAWRAMAQRLSNPEMPPTEATLEASFQNRGSSCRVHS